MGTAVSVNPDASSKSVTAFFPSTIDALEAAQLENWCE